MRAPKAWFPCFETQGECCVQQLQAAAWGGRSRSRLLEPCVRGMEAARVPAGCFHQTFPLCCPGSRVLCVLCDLPSACCWAAGEVPQPRAAGGGRAPGAPLPSLPSRALPSHCFLLPSQGQGRLLGSATPGTCPQPRAPALLQPGLRPGTGGET